MALPKFTIQDLMEAGVHFGHTKRRWNPAMKNFIYGTRDGVHIIDLQKTAPMLLKAMYLAKDIASKGGKILFVGTKKQAQPIVKEFAELCGGHYVSHRWLGGMFTNWKTVSKSLHKLNQIEKDIANAEKLGLTKKEILMLDRKREKLENVFQGIKEINGAPDLMIVIDTEKEQLAIDEARNLNVPVIGICDTNSQIDTIDFPIPGNDDAIRALELYCSLLAKSALEGVKEQLKGSGKDLGAEVAPKTEKKAETKADSKKPEVKVEKKAPAKKVVKEEAPKTEAKKAPAKKSSPKKETAKKEAEAK